MSKNKLTYKTVIDVISFTFICVILNNATVSGGFLSLPFFISICYNKKKPILFSVLFTLSFAISLNFSMIVSAVISSIFITLVFLVYNSKNKKPNAELIFYSIISCLPFIFLRSDNNYVTPLIESALNTVLAFVFIYFTKIVYVKKLSSKINGSEYVCLCLALFFLELGFIRTFSLLALKSVIIFAILVTGYVCKNSYFSVICAIILGLAPSAFSLSLSPIATYALLSVISCVFIKNSRIISAFLLLLGDILFLMIFKLYGDFIYTDVFYSIIPVAVFIFFPKEILQKINDALLSFDDKVLSRYTVNRIRASLSNKLYGVSDVFFEMQNSFEKLKECTVKNDELLTRMCDEVIHNVCKNCLSYGRCVAKNLPDRAELIKILSVGISKNRITLIDLTKNFTENCGYTNSVIFEMNGLITKYKEKIKELENLSVGKELIKLQSEGVANMLKSMALDMSRSLSYSKDIEKKLYDELKKRGVTVNEIMAISNGDDYEFEFVLPRATLVGSTFIKTVSQTLQKQMNVVSKTGLSESKCAVTIKPAPPVDAAFGLSYASKDGSTKSGDTHSLVKLNEGKFLIALSDGMGSGIKAENTSSTAISLIESFYKAGLESSLILSIVNKILALNTDDNFSAMDILTVDLFSLTADFIKIGAPQSYILSPTAIKLIEGSSLPLGILDDLKPTGCQTGLELGNVVVMVTDGISDSFGSSTDFIDFLKTLPCNNPQVISDSILKRAVELNGGKKKDDMTVLAVRFFSKNCHKGVA